MFDKHKHKQIRVAHTFFSRRITSIHRYIYTTDYVATYSSRKYIHVHICICTTQRACGPTSQSLHLTVIRTRRYIYVYKHTYMWPCTHVDGTMGGISRRSGASSRRRPPRPPCDPSSSRGARGRRSRRNRRPPPPRSPPRSCGGARAPGPSSPRASRTTCMYGDHQFVRSIHMYR